MFGGTALLQLLVIKDSYLSNMLLLLFIKVWFFFRFNLNFFSFKYSERHTYMLFAI